MKASIETQADMLKTLMSEDRQEIRGIRLTIYKVVTLLATVSFAITSFLIGRAYHRTNALCVATDVLIVALMWGLVTRLKRDLYCCRQCLVMRQNLIKALDQDNPKDLDPFPDARTVMPDVSDSELWWIPIFATVIIALKAVGLWFLQ
jgi:hypothetical protein